MAQLTLDLHIGTLSVYLFIDLLSLEHSFLAQGLLAK